MLQNATPLRKSAPWPPNSSDENVSCTAPAMENASLQILFKCPTPAIVFGNATKPSRLAHFWEGAQSLAPATRNELWTSKRGPYVVCFVHFDFEMCFAPHWRAASRPSYPPRGVKNVTYIFGVPLCRVSGPWLYTAYIHIYVGCFTQIHEVNVKMLHYIFRLGKQIYKSNL